VSSLVLESDIIVGVAAAALLCWFPHLWFGPDGRFRKAVIQVVWALACSMIALNALARPIYDDEVFYLAHAYAVHGGAPSSSLPLRVWPYYAFLALHLSPAATLVVSRVVMILAAILAGLGIRSIARRIDDSGTSASLVGALAALSLANLPMGTLVPEYIAFLFLLAAIWVMLAAPERWPRACCLFLSGFMMACACGTSLRLPLFGAAALVAVFIEPGRLSRIRALLWTCGGMLAGSLPSILYVLIKSSISEFLYWNYTLPQRVDLVNITSPVSLPAELAIIAAFGCWSLWKARNRLFGCVALIAFWGAGTVSAILNPQKLEHSTGPWLAVSFIAAAAALNGVLAAKPGVTGKRVFVLLVILLFVAQIAPNVPQFQDPSEIRTNFALAGSGLRMINWLSEVADGNPVACVPPFHPVFAPNAWKMWNTIYFCYVREPEMNSQLEPHLVDTLRSGRAAIVEWDPWPAEADVPNVLLYLVDRGFVSAAQLPQLAAELRGSYRLVQWLGPIEEEFGGGRFLVRRDIKLDDRIRVLDDSLILHPGAQ